MTVLDRGLAKPLTARWAIAAFDLDGTLIHGTTTLLHLGQKLGRQTETMDLVDGYESYRLSNFEVTERAAQFFVGYSPDDLGEMLDDCPRLDKISNTVASLSERGVHTIIATITFRFAAAHFALRHGFDAYDGIDLAIDRGGCFTGEVLRHVTEADKLAFVASQAQSLRTDLSQVAFFGDSRSDLPCFGSAGLAIAVNASPQARDAATIIVDGDSLAPMVDAAFD